MSGNGNDDTESAAALLSLAASPVVHLVDSSDEEAAAGGSDEAGQTVSVSLRIIGDRTVQSKCAAIHSSLRASKVEIYIGKDQFGHKDKLFGSIKLDDRSDSSFAIVSMEVDNQVKSPHGHKGSDELYISDLIHADERLDKNDGHYFVRDFQTRIQTSNDQELALNLSPSDKNILFLQWRGTDPDGFQLSLELKGRRQTVVL